MGTQLETIERIKCVVIGDGGSGKTSLLVVYTEGSFPEDYIPTVFENYTAEVEIDSNKVHLMLWDTAGQEDYDRLRPLSYDKVDVIIICYDVTSQASFENVSVRWIPEVKHFCPNVPVILVACKTDLRPDSKNCDPNIDIADMSPNNFDRQKRLSTYYQNRIITTAEGEKNAKSINASAFLECSAKNSINVNEVFETATRKALYKPSSKLELNCCCIV